MFELKRLGFVSLAVLAALLSAGCGAVVSNGHAVLVGAVYTRVTYPLTHDLDRTPAAEAAGSGKIIRIKEPVSGYGVYAEFNSNALGEIARHNGLKTLHYADIERLSVLGIWRHDEITLWGEK